MGRSRFWAAGLAVMVALGFPAPVYAGGGTFVMANTASNFVEPVPRGALLSLFTDLPVSPEERVAYQPWVQVASGGLFVEVTCTSLLMAKLPIVSIKESGDGHQVDVYFPNSLGTEPFGRCDNDGMADVTLRPADGFGPAMVRPVATVLGHPGIFSIGLNADGVHIEGLTGKITPLAVCTSVQGICPVRTSGQPAVLQVRLTGAEMFLCQPCTAGNIFFELAPVVNGQVGVYQAQNLTTLVRVSTGVEEATIQLRTDLTGGEYRLRVRNTVRPEIPEPLTIRLGPPVS